jgi:invasion protein IalB
LQGKVEGEMANSLTTLVRWRAARVAAVVALGLAGASVAVAQQPAKKPDKAAPAAKAPPKGAAKAPAKSDQGGSNPAQSAWVKLCEKATGTVREKDGKEAKKDFNICLTHHERLDGNSGMVLVSAAARVVEGQEKQHFMVMVPLGMMLQAGMRATIFPKDMWEKLQKKEDIDESKLKAIRLAYTLCHPAGCTAETELTPELLNDLNTAGGLMVFSINAAGHAVPFPVPLVGFAEAHKGGPVDGKKYSEARRQLMAQIAQRQQQLMEEYKKKKEEQKDASKDAPKAAPAQKK